MILTGINSENAPDFQYLSPSVFLSPELTSDMFVIGALTEEEHLPAGILIFDISSLSPEDCAENKPFIRLFWICVNESMRCKGTGHLLMEELFRIADKAGIKEISLTLPKVFDDDPELPEKVTDDSSKEFFRHLGFSFKEYEEVALHTQVEDLIDPMNLKHLTEKSGISPVDSLSEKQLKSFFARCGIEPEKFIPDPENGFDAVLSSTYIQKNRISGILLLHLDSFDEATPVIDDMILKVSPGLAYEDIKTMFLFSLSRAMKVYGPELEVNCISHDPAVADVIKFLQKDCPFDIIETGLKKL